MTSNGKLILDAMKAAKKTNKVRIPQPKIPANKPKDMLPKQFADTMPQFEGGGLWDLNKRQWVDSVNNANINKDFIKRFYNQSLGSIQIPGEPGRSTHFMSYDPGSRRAYPTVVNINGRLTYLPDEDQAWNYADNTGEYIEFPTPEQAKWYASSKDNKSGYKMGTGVLGNNPKKGLPKKAKGGPTDLKNPSIVDYLNFKGLPTNKSYRKDLAKTYGVEDYDYSANKNLELLSKLRAEDLNNTPTVRNQNNASMDAFRQKLMLESGADPMLEGVSRSQMVNPRIDLATKIPSRYNIPTKQPVVRKQPVVPLPEFSPYPSFGKTPVTTKTPVTSIPPFNPYPFTKQLSNLPKKTTAKTAAANLEKNIEEKSWFESIGETVSDLVEKASYAPEWGLRQYEKYIKPEVKAKSASIGKVPIKPKAPNKPYSLTGDLPMIGSDTLDVGTLPRSSEHYYTNSAIVDLNKVNVGARNRGDYSQIPNLEGNVLNAWSNPSTMKEGKMYIGLDKNSRILTGTRADLKNAVTVSEVPFTQSNEVGNNYIPEQNYQLMSLANNDKNNFPLNISLGKDGSPDANDRFGGGATIIETPDKKQKYLVRGSVNQIKKAFNDLKKNTGHKYLNVYMLDNGSYNTGLKTKDRISSPEELRSYERKNTSGGHGFYFKEEGGSYNPFVMANGGYVVTRSHDRKGKTHKVTGPDGTVKYFGDSKLGQHPNDPERKKAFYARHKHNLEHNPFFRAFARKTWEEGGETDKVIPIYDGIPNPNKRVKDIERYYDLKQRIADEYTKPIKSESFGFIENWMASPMYDQMLKESTLDSEAFKHIRSNLFNKFKNNGSWINADYEPTTKDKIKGEFFPKNNLIALSRKNIKDLSGRQNVAVHELSHASDVNEDFSMFIPKKDYSKMEKYKKEYYNSLDSTNKKFYNDNADYNKYLESPTETRARLNVLRFIGKENKIYNPFIEKINKNKFKQFDKFTDPDYIQPLNDLRYIYSDDQIIDMLNTISKTKNSKESFEAKLGGEMIRRADGSYSRKGLWDNIRANKGSGKRPTKEMLEQERKIRLDKKEDGGNLDYIYANSRKDLVPQKVSKKTPFKKVEEPYLVDVSRQTAIDQLPYSPYILAAKGFNEGKPFTGLSELLKLPFGPFGDAIGNIMQENPYGIDIKTLEEKVVPYVRLAKNALFGNPQISEIGKQILLSGEKPNSKWYAREYNLPYLFEAAKSYNIDDNTFTKFIEDNWDNSGGDYKKILEMANKKFSKKQYGGYMEDGGGTPDVPTTKDSLNLYNAQMALNDFYNNEIKKGRLTKVSKNKFNSNYENTGRLNQSNLMFYKNLINDRQLLGNGTYDNSYKAYFNLNPEQISKLEFQGLRKTKSASKYQQYYRDLITPLQNLAAPFALVDSRINPQYRIGYEPVKARYPGGHVDVYDYDPLAIKPYYLRTPQEKLDWEKKYGSNKGQPNKNNVVKKQTNKESVKQVTNKKPQSLEMVRQQISPVENNTTTSQSTQTVVPTPVVPRTNYNQGTPVYAPTPYASGPGAFVGYETPQGDTVFVKPEDYERMGVPYYGKEFINKNKKQKYGGFLPKAEFGVINNIPVKGGEKQPGSLSRADLEKMYALEKRLGTKTPLADFAKKQQQKEQPYFKQDNRTTREKEIAQQLLAEAYMNEQRGNSPFARTLASYTPMGNNTEAARAAAEQFGEMTPIMSGKRLFQTMSDPKNNPYGISSDAGWKNNMIGSLAAAGDMLDASPVIPVFNAYKGAAEAFSNSLNPYIKKGVNTFKNTADIPSFPKRLRNAIYSGSTAVLEPFDKTHHSFFNMSPDEVADFIKMEKQNAVPGTLFGDNSMSINSTPIYWSQAARDAKKYPIIRTGDFQFTNDFGWKGKRVENAIPKKIKDLYSEDIKQYQVLKADLDEQLKQNLISKDYYNDLINHNSPYRKMLTDLPYQHPDEYAKFLQNYKPVLDNPIKLVNEKTGLNFPMSEINYFYRTPEAYSIKDPNNRVFKILTNSLGEAARGFKDNFLPRDQFYFSPLRHPSSAAGTRRSGPPSGSRRSYIPGSLESYIPDSFGNTPTLNNIFDENNIDPGDMVYHELKHGGSFNNKKQFGGTQLKNKDMYDFYNGGDFMPQMREGGYYDAEGHFRQAQGTGTWSGNAYYRDGGNFYAATPRFIQDTVFDIYKLFGGSTDDQEQMAYGGIHIKPSKRGTFTAAATKHNMGVQAFARQVLSNKENYSPAMVKKANFARNAASWKHQYGGPVEGEEMDVTPEQLEQLRQQGYQFEILD